MKSPKQQIENLCKFYTGFCTENCLAGVKYADVRITTTRPFKAPCHKGGIFAGGTCDKAKFPTPEEAAKSWQDLKNESDIVIKALIKVKEYIRETSKSSGVIDCPNCGGALEYIMAKVNGHTSGRCNCGVNWRE